MVIKLVIKHKDGSIYWTEHFNDREACDAWLKEERTRPYWDPKFKVEIEDNSEAQKKEQEEAFDRMKGRASARESAILELKELRKKKTRNAAENQAILEKVLDLLEI